MTKTYSFTALILCSLIMSTAYASIISVESYSMLNGNRGSFTYFDDNYTGSGNTQVVNALLSGGVGKLTDGVIANQIWCNTENTGTCNALGQDINGLYVGWFNLNPTITFSFASDTIINRLYIYADDSEYSPITQTVTEGAFGYGGLTAPTSVFISELSRSFILGNVANAGPNTYVLDFESIETDTLTLQFNRNTPWVLISEIQFENTASVNAPSSALLLVACSLFMLLRLKHK
ncbi:hypothetical protein KUL156_55860 [Alteromonas sp. KUL156]|nr:hypothetical protein KUL154_60790 [Alteromonas sp. KUL154]GFE02994.1 hypothetical protein KUL156_55860 [Alteromonas sp. KUL156]